MQSAPPRREAPPNYDAFGASSRQSKAAAQDQQATSQTQQEGWRRVQMEPRLGVPTFLWASGAKQVDKRQLSEARAQAKLDIEYAARDHLGINASHYRLSTGDVASATLVAIHDTGKGAIIAKFKQDVGGVEVFREEINVVMSRDLQLVALTGYLTGDGANLQAQDFNLQPAQALSKAVEDLTGTALSPSVFRGRNPEVAPGEAANPYTLYTAEAGAAQGFAFSDEPLRVKKVMFHLPDGYVPAYYVEAFLLLPSQDATLIDVSGGPVMTEVAYSYVISAVDGQLLFRNNLIDEDGEYTYRVWADPTTKLPYDTPAGNVAHPKVVPLPDGAQAPFVPQNEVTLRNFPFSMNDPWLGPGATETNGNNVDAFVNLVNGNGNVDNGFGPVMSTIVDFASGDHRAHTNGVNSFLYTHQPEVDAFSAGARQASIAQLFYNINFLHDWFYDSGFDEASRNAQKDNYGRGGLGSDDIKAQVQDTASFNNANMLTPADGSRPRMRMYNFPNPANMLDVQAPAGIQSKLRIGISQTGPRNFDVTSDIVVATFSNSPSACTVTNAAALAGKIAMFDFDNTDGTSCAFGTRITRIHATGAAAALMVYNSAPANANLVANITGINATHTKPVAVISWNSAAPIKTQLAAANTVTARLLRLADRDGALDNQIVAHEWGHYISGRLIGNGSGLNNQQGGGMGEGWGDFLAMLLTVRPDDTSTPSNATWGGAYALATYATGGVPFSGTLNHGYYLGIRRTPYSTDMANYNALTFKHIQDGVPLPSGPPIASTPGVPNSQVHNTGEVWATMLWECYAALLRDTQGSSPRLSFNEAQTRMKNYLVAGFKMTPSSPTFLEARDAILAAAFTYDYQDGLLFAQAFAKRGAGLNAVAPDRFSTNNSPVTESFEAGGWLAYVGASLDDTTNNCDVDGYLDNGETGVLKVTLKNAGFLNLLNTTATVSSNNPHVTFPGGATLNFSPTQPGETVTASMAVKVVGAIGVETSDFTITFQDTGSPAVAPVAVHFFAYLNADESGPVTATDNVEPRQTSWTESSNPSFLNTPTAKWRRVSGTTSLNHLWFVTDPDAPSEQFLTSPVFTVDGSGSVNVQFDHSWGFESSGGSNFDGGVVEMSVNGGAWTDIGTSAYNGTLVNYTGNLNPLKGRQAFVGSSNGTHTSLTNAVAPGSTVQIRFRFGSDNAAGTDGWRIDNIAFTGVVETPFRLLNPETVVCGMTTPSTGITITFSPETLPAAAAGEAYTATITPSGGTAPYTFNVTPVVLPAGLSSSIVGNAVQISGTPAHAGVSLVGVTATDNASNQGSKTYALTINKGSSTTTVTVSNAVYDSNQHGGTAAVTGFGGLNQSLTVTYTGRNATTYGPSTTPPTNVGEYTASASFPGDADHNGSSDSKNFQISKAGQTISFGPLADKTFGDAQFNVTATGGASGNPVTFAATGNCTSGGTNGATITITGAGSCTVTASQAGNNNFNAAADVAQSFNIAKATATVTLHGLDQTYDGTARAATATTSPAGLSVLSIGYKQNGVDVAAPTAAGSYDVTASLSNANYQAADATGTLVIAKANQTITFGALSNKTFGDADFNVSATSSSGLGVSFSASGQCTVSGSSVHLTGAGSCTITASQAGDSNFNATPNVERSFNVAKVNQTITFGALASKTFGDADFNVSATSSSGLGVSFSAAGNCSISGSTVHITGAGSCTIIASQGGDTSYNAAPDVARIFSIAKAGQTITFGALSSKTFTDADFTVSATASSGLAVSFAANGQCTVTGNTVHLTGGGSCTITASQAGDNDHNAAAPVPQTFSIAKANQTITFGALSNKTFGDADFNVSATSSSGLGVSFSASGQCTVTGSTVHITGAGSCTITASGASTSSYNAAPDVAQSFNIAQAATMMAVTTSTTPSDLGQSVTFTATVTSLAGTPTGSVQFKVDGADSGSPVVLSSGVATYTLNSLTAGPHIISAEYGGDGNFSASTSSITGGQVVKDQPVLSITDLSIAEGDSGTTSAVFTVILSAASNLAVQVNYATGNGTATAGSDYQSKSGTLTFNPGGSLTQTITVLINGDTANELDETFTLNLTGAQNTALARTQANGNILNDDSPGLQFSGNIYSFSEGAGHGDIIVTRKGDISQAASVDYQTIDLAGMTPCQTNNTGQASDRCDYATARGTLHFAANEATKTLPLVIINDAYLEGDETLSIRLLNPAGAGLGSIDTATLTITDDDVQMATQNPIDNLQFFIREQYIDFLGREPEAAGFQFWFNRVNDCPQGQTSCDRIDASLRFFQSDEFQARGFYVYRLYDAVLGRLPRYLEFVPEVARLNGAQTVTEQRQNKDAYLLDFVTKTEFRSLYGQYLTVDGLQATNAAGFVDALCQQAGLTPASRQTLITNLQNGTRDPAHTVEDFILTPEMSEVGTTYYDRGFIVMQYFGYLRRDPEQAGFDFWVSQLIGTSAPHRGDYRFMVGGFLQADEYRYRFAQISAAP